MFFIFSFFLMQIHNNIKNV